MTRTPPSSRPEFEGTTCCVLAPSPVVPGFIILALENAARRGLEIVTAITPSEPTGEGPQEPAHLRLFDSGPPSELTTLGSLERMGPVTAESVAGSDAAINADVVLDLRASTTSVGGLEKHAGALTYDFLRDTPGSWRGVGLREWLDQADDVPLMLVRNDRTRDAMASARSKVHRHSYRATREQALAMSVHLFALGLRNLLVGRAPTDAPTSTPPGKRRQPTATEVRLTMLFRSLDHLRGRLLSTTWQVGFAPPIDLGGVGSGALDVVESVETPPAYAFLADPAVVDTETIVCEALDAQSRTGRLVRVRRGTIDVLDTSAIGSGHLSYPHVVDDGSDRYLLPEMSNIGSQQIFPFDPESGQVGAGAPLIGVEGLRLVDATLLHHDRRWWLFAGVGLEGPDRRRRDRARPSHDSLFLWHAPSMLGPYVAHPDSPVVRDPARARMAGPVIQDGGRLYRLGQDNRDHYGDGITVAEITKIDAETYREKAGSRLRIRGHHGPHTLERFGDRFVIDYFDQHLSITDSWRRLLALFSNRRSATRAKQMLPN